MHISPKTPQGTVQAFLQQQALQKGAGEAVSRSSRSRTARFPTTTRNLPAAVVRPPAINLQKPQADLSSEAYSLGGLLLGGVLGGGAALGIGLPALPFIGAGALLGSTVPRIYDYFTKPSGPPPSILPDEILRNPRSAPEFNIGVNRGSTYREDGTFGKAPRIIGFDGDDPILEPSPSGNSWYDKLADSSRRVAWEQKLRNEKQAFDNPIREATLGLPGRLLKNYVGDFALATGTLPQRLGGVWSRTAAMPGTAFSKPYSFLFGQNEEWMPNTTGGKGLIHELLRTWEPEGQAIEQIGGFIHGVLGRNKNSPEQTLNFMMAGKYGAGERANIIANFRATGKWPTDIIPEPSSLDYIGAHLTDAINNAEAIYGSLPAGEQMAGFLVGGGFGGGAAATKATKLGNALKYLPHLSFAGDISRWQKQYRHANAVFHNAQLSLTNNLTPLINNVKDVSAVVQDISVFKVPTALQSFRKGLVKMGVSSVDFDTMTKSAISTTHGLESILENFFKLGDGDNFAQILDGLLTLENYGTKGFVNNLGEVIEGTNKQKSALQMFTDMNMHDMPVTDDMSSILGLKKGTKVSALNSTTGLLGRSILKNIVDNTLPQMTKSKIERSPQAIQALGIAGKKTLVELLGIIRNTDLSQFQPKGKVSALVKQQNKIKYKEAADSIDKAQIEILDWAVNATLKTEFGITDLEKFRTPNEWKQWHSFFAKWLHIGPVFGVGVRNIVQDVAKLALQDNQMLAYNNIQFMNYFRENSRSFTSLRGRLSGGKLRVSTRGFETVIDEKPKSAWQKFMQLGAFSMGKGEKMLNDTIMSSTVERLMRLYSQRINPDVSGLREAGMGDDEIQGLINLVKGSWTNKAFVEKRAAYFNNPNRWDIQITPALLGLQEDGIDKGLYVVVQELLDPTVNVPNADVFKNRIFSIMQELREEGANSLKVKITEDNIINEGLVDAMSEFKWKAPIDSELDIVNQKRLELNQRIVVTDDWASALIFAHENPTLEYSKNIVSNFEDQGLDVEKITEALRKQLSVSENEQRAAQAAKAIVAQGNRGRFRTLDDEFIRTLFEREFGDAYNPVTTQIFETHTAPYEDNILYVESLFGELARQQQAGSNRVVDFSTIPMRKIEQFPGTKDVDTFADFMARLFRPDNKFYIKHGANNFTAVPITDMQILKKEIVNFLRDYGRRAGGMAGSILSEIGYQARTLDNIDPETIRKTREAVYGIKLKHMMDMSYSVLESLSKITGDIDSGVIEGLNIQKYFNPDPVLREELLATLAKIARTRKNVQVIRVAQAKGKVLAPDQISGMLPANLNAKRISAYEEAIESVRFDPKSVGEFERDAIATLQGTTDFTKEDAEVLLRRLGVEEKDLEKVMGELTKTGVVQKSKRFLYDIFDVIRKADSKNLILPLSDPSKGEASRLLVRSVYKNADQDYLNISKADAILFKNNGRVVRVRKFLSSTRAIVEAEPAYLGMQPLSLELKVPGGSFPTEKEKEAFKILPTTVSAFIDRNFKGQTPEDLAEFYKFATEGDVREILSQLPKTGNEYTKHIKYLKGLYGDFSDIKVADSAKRISTMRVGISAMQKRIDNAFLKVDKTTRTKFREDRIDEYAFPGGVGDLSNLEKTEAFSGMPKAVTEDNMSQFMAYAEKLASSVVLARYTGLSKATLTNEIEQLNNFLEFSRTMGYEGEQLTLYLYKKIDELSFPLENYIEMYKGVDIQNQKITFIRARTTSGGERLSTTNQQELVNKIEEQISLQISLIAERYRTTRSSTKYKMVTKNILGDLPNELNQNVHGITGNVISYKDVRDGSSNYIYVERTGKNPHQQVIDRDIVKFNSLKNLARKEKESITVRMEYVPRSVKTVSAYQIDLPSLPKEDTALLTQHINWQMTKFFDLNEAPKFRLKDMVLAVTGEDGDLDRELIAFIKFGNKEMWIPLDVGVIGKKGQQYSASFPLIIPNFSARPLISKNVIQQIIIPEMVKGSIPITPLNPLLSAPEGTVVGGWRAFYNKDKDLKWINKGGTVIDNIATKLKPDTIAEAIKSLDAGPVSTDDAPGIFRRSKNYKFISGGWEFTGEINKDGLNQTPPAKVQEIISAAPEQIATPVSIDDVPETLIDDIAESLALSNSDDNVQRQLTNEDIRTITRIASLNQLNKIIEAVDLAVANKMPILNQQNMKRPEIAGPLNEFFNKAQAQLNMTRAVAQRAGSAMVDDYIYNYGEKYNFDHVMESMFGYPLWYLRTFSDYPRQLMTDPYYLSKLFKFNQIMNNLHRDEENLPLWMRSSVPLNIEKLGLRDMIGTDTVYLPLLSQLSPLESLLNGDFTNATREKSAVGMFYNKLYGWGPGPHALVPLALGTAYMARSIMGGTEEDMNQANQYFNYLGSQQRLLPAITAQMEKMGAYLPMSGGISAEPLVLAFAAVGAMGAPNKNMYLKALMAGSALAQGWATHSVTKDGLKFVGPIYDQRRVANLLAAWGNEPGKVVNGISITPEILQDAAIVSREPYELGKREEYATAYAVWSAAVTESRAQKLIPNLLSFFGGPGVSARGENEIIQEQMYNQVDALYDMQKDPNVSQTDYERAWLKFSMEYPNFPVFSIFKKYGTDSFNVYAYSALSRVGRGASAKAVYDTVGLDYNVVNTFFANKGMFQYGTDQVVFQEGIIKLALLLQSPDMSTKEEWGEAGILFHELQREMEITYPGTTAKQDVYFDLETKQRPGFLNDHLDLKTRMDTEMAIMVKDPRYKDKMAPYYVSLKDAENFLKSSYMSQDPVKAKLLQHYLENHNDWPAEKEKQFLADYDLFEFHRGYLKVAAEVKNSIYLLTSEFELPKLPKVRLDSPEIEAKKSIQNALESLSQTNQKNYNMSRAAAKISGSGIAGGGADAVSGATGSGVLGSGAGADLVENWEYLYSLTHAKKIGYIKELGDQLKFETLQPILNAVNGNPTAFLNTLDTPLLSGKWTTFNDPLKWEENLVNYVKMLGGENLRSSMMIEVSRGSLDPSQMVWSKVIGTVKSLSDSEIGTLTGKYPELRDLQQVRAEAREHPAPTLNALMDVVGANISIQEDGTISVSGQTVKKDKPKTSGKGGKKGDRLDGGDIEEYISKWSKHYYGNNIEQLYDQYIMVSVAQGADAGRKFWKKYPQLAQYQAFSNKLWKRYKENKSGPPTKDEELKEIIKGVGLMMSTSKQQARGDSNQGSYSIMREIISNRKMYLPKSPIGEKSRTIDGSMYANVIAVIKASNPNLAISFAEFIQANPVKRQAILQSNPDLARYITQFTPEQLGDIEQSYNVGLEIGGQSVSRGGGVRVYEQRSGRTGL